MLAEYDESEFYIKDLYDLKQKQYEEYCEKRIFVETNVGDNFERWSGELDGREVTVCDGAIFD